MSEAATAVVQVMATSCDDGPRTGTGFFFSTSSEVVTDLHVIAGCTDLTVHVSGENVTASLFRTLPNADLALLRVPSQSDVHPLEESQNIPQVNDTLEVIGYYFTAPTPDSRPLHVTLGKPVLEDMLTDDLRAAIFRAGSPNLMTDILRLDGNLVPGLSGAPVIDQSGQVVGIGSGGLENGTVGISWAVQSHYLGDLESAPANSGSAPSLAGASPLFAAPVQGADETSVQCGDFSFAYIKTRSLGQLLASADDVIGLQQIAEAIGYSPQQTLGFEYDVYTEPLSGGSVAVPQGTTFVSSNGLCLGQIANGLDITLGSTFGNSPQAIETASEVFENEFDKGNLFWYPDPSFTYPAARGRSDGLVVRRKNAVGYFANVLSGDAFETLISRGNTFIGVRVRDLDYALPYQECSMQPYLNGCDQVNALRQLWVTAALGVQLSTFPRN